MGNNVLSILDVMPGLRVSTSSAPGLMGPQFATINGLDMNSVNVTRDGLTQNDTRFSSAGDVTGGVAIPHGGGIGVMSSTTINPDLVGEVRMILSPIDAELGRGNSQIQIQTRSGTNQYRGSAAWNVINNALNANTWGNNRQINPQTGAWAPLRPDWRNVHDYTVAFGGPIVKNKTFFYALWDQNISNLRATVNAHVLTNEARQGIFRYWEGWVGAARTRQPTRVLPPQRLWPIRKSILSISQGNPFARPHGRTGRRTPAVWFASAFSETRNSMAVRSARQIVQAASIAPAEPITQWR